MSQPQTEKKNAAPEVSDTIKVVIRFKGREKLTDSEISKWEFDENYKSVQAPRPPGDNRTNMETLRYTFDDILVEASQEKMYYYAGQETVKLFTSGFNGTIFAYGMSGTGKTYSMLGPETVVEVIKQGGEISEEVQSQYGIIPRAICDIFEFMNYAIEKEGASFELMMNYFEIYKESLNDLLQPNKDQASNLKMMGSKVVNSYKVMIDSPETIFDHIKRGQNRVHTESTGMNDRSSRSHSILVLEYNQINKDGSKKNAKLNLVDLAGSERIAKTGASGKVLEEAKKINLSLTVLGRVIQALGEGGNVPFRESTLTKLLKESLGGNSKTALLCTTSRADCHLEETIQSLQFAKRVKKVKNKAVVSVQLTSEQMQALIVKLKQEVYVLRQKLIVTNGSAVDKTVAAADSTAQQNGPQDKNKDGSAADKASKKGAEKVDRAPATGTSAKSASTAKKESRVTKDTTASKDAKKKTTATSASSAKQTKADQAKLSMDTKKEQVKAMLAQSQAAQAPQGDLETIKEVAAPADAPNQETKNSAPDMPQTPRKDQDRNLSQEKVAEVVTENMSPFKTPSKAPGEQSDLREGRHSFLQSFTSDQQSMRKSLIENPYSSFISLQSEYFDTNTRVCQIQNPADDNAQPKISSEQFETLQELIQRQQVQLDSRNDLLIQRDTEIDRLYMENSQLTKNVDQLKEKIDNQAMDVYFKVADEMNKQFKNYYSTADSCQQMNELFDDLKKQSEQESTQNNKTLFTSIANIESEMQRYQKWIEQTKETMQLTNHGLALPTSADIQLKPQVCNALSDLNSEKLVDKDKIESLQKVINKPEVQITDYDSNDSLRAALVNTTLTNLHILHQYKSLLHLVKDNFMSRQRGKTQQSPVKQAAAQEAQKQESKTEETFEPNSGLNPEIITPTSVQINNGSFKTEESKPTCETDKSDYVQVVLETQELISLRNQVKIQTDMYNEKVQEIKNQHELVERLKRQHENLREQINRVDKENIKLKKKMDQDNLNRQQQYLTSLQDPQQFQYPHQKADGITSWVSNMFNNAVGHKVIQKKVDVNGGGFFSKKVFSNNPWQQNQSSAFSPAARTQEFRPNTGKRVSSPSKRGITQVNTYEYSGKAFVPNPEVARQIQGTDLEFKRKDRKHPGNVSTDFSNQKVENTLSYQVKGRDSQGSCSSNKMQKIQLSVNNNEDNVGTASVKSNKSFRMAEHALEFDQSKQVTSNSFISNGGQVQYQQKANSPKKTDKFERNEQYQPLKLEHMNSAGIMSSDSLPGARTHKPVPRVKKYTRQEIENRPGKYDQDNFYILPGGDFFDPQGFYFDKKGYDQLGGYYDDVTGQYIPGQEYAHLTMQKNQSYHAGDNRSSNKKNRFGGFENGMQEDTQLRRNYGSFHAHQNNQTFHVQQYSNFFPQKGGWNTRNINQGYHSNTQQDFNRRNTANGVDGVSTPAKDKRNFDDYEKLSSHSKNSFVRDGNFKPKQRQFKPTYEKTYYTVDKPVEKPGEYQGTQEQVE